MVPILDEGENSIAWAMVLSGTCASGFYAYMGTIGRENTICA